MEQDIITFRYEKKRKSFFFFCRFAVSIFVIIFLTLLFSRQVYLLDSASRKTSKYSEFIFHTRNVTKSLAVERGLTSKHLGSRGNRTLGEIMNARKVTDEAMSNLTGFLREHFVDKSFSGEIPGFEFTLASIRKRVDVRDIGGLENIDKYSRIVVRLLSNIIQVDSNYGDISKVGYALYNFLRLQDNLGSMRGVLGFISSKGFFNPDLRKIVIGHTYREKLYTDNLVKLYPEIQTIIDEYNEKIDIKIASEYLHGVLEIIEDSSNYTISTNPNLLFDWMFNLIDEQQYIQSYLFEKLDKYVNEHMQNFYFLFFGFLGCILLEISALSWVMYLTFPSMKKNCKKGRPWGQINVIRDTILMDISQEKSF